MYNIGLQQQSYQLIQIDFAFLLTFRIFIYTPVTCQPNPCYHGNENLGKNFLQQICYIIRLVFKIGPRYLLQSGVLGVRPFYCVIQSSARLTLVVMVTKINIDKFQQEIGYNSDCN